MEEKTRDMLEKIKQAASQQELKLPLTILLLLTARPCTLYVSGFLKLACVLFDFNNDKYSYYQFCDRHGKPDCVCSCGGRQQIDETSADHSSSSH